ncbi:hypothetical protein EDD90_2692 [Streptomyces sp. Ag109_O5-1]|uniref:hypothetical protein n=1 Tax=Streptomyces sp. Ag109_O5-1 TaxID=1938851 RepID=UPI000F501EDB|nr:hypothetical protein [Streptomyces sp. Ag109_O5-1]RPE39675.1 hypothetical protein EDD90_2692 [Streptomyces sp. Ag109_O5-1]
MAIPPDSIRGLILFACPTNPWLLLSTRLTVWAALSLLSALTPLYNTDAPLWIWPFALIACLLMAGQTIGAMRSKSQGRTG